MRFEDPEKIRFTNVNIISTMIEIELQFKSKTDQMKNRY